jgi:hypothetical protein
LIEELVSRHGVALTIPAKEAAWASGELMRGVWVEWLLEPSTASRELFEPVHLALMSGLTTYPERRTVVIAAAPSAVGVGTPTPDDLLARDRWPRERLLAFQRERLRELLRHASASSPYYRELLGQDAEDAELGDLPTLTKATLMEQFDCVVADMRLRLEAVEARAACDEPAALLLGEYHVFSTSGTTGRRGVFPQRGVRAPRAGSAALVSPAARLSWVDH